MTLRTLMEQVLEKQKERRSKRAVGFVSLERAPPKSVKLAIDNFYKSVCTKLSVDSCKELYVFLLDDERYLWLLCRRTLRGKANWVASALARTMVRGPALIMRSYSLAPRRLLDFCEGDYRHLETDYHVATDYPTRKLTKKLGGPLRKMMARERHSARVVFEVDKLRRSSRGSEVSSSLGSYTVSESESESE